MMKDSVNYGRFFKLLVSKDGSPGVRTEEKKTRKFMMETKRVQKDLLNIFIVLLVRQAKTVAYTI